METPQREMHFENQVFISRHSPELDDAFKVRPTILSLPGNDEKIYPPSFLL
jgi:hypothetical protein